MNTPIGTVFQCGGNYWKVLTPPNDSFEYGVVLCTKSGKEKNDYCNLDCNYVDNLEWKDGVKFVPTGGPSLSDSHAKRTEFLTKMRIKSLREQIEAAENEIAELEESLK